VWLRLCVCWAFRHFRFYLKLTRKILLYPLGDSAWLPHFTVTTVALLSLLLVLRVSSLVYRVIHKSLRDFRPLRYSSRDGHAQRGACQHVCGRNLITGLTSAASPRVDISSTCKVGQKFRVSLSLCWHAPLRRDHPGYCTAGVGKPGGNCELPCIFSASDVTDDSVGRTVAMVWDG